MTDDTRASILHLDPDAMIRRIVAEYLGVQGYALDGCPSPPASPGEACGRYDLVIADLLSDRAATWDFFRTARLEGYAGPILLLTGTPLSRDERQTLDDLGGVLMEKPFGPSHLADRVLEIFSETRR